MKHILLVYTQANRILADALESEYRNQEYRVSRLSMKSRLETHDIVRYMGQSNINVFIVSKQFLSSKVVNNVLQQAIKLQVPSIIVLVSGSDEIMAILPVTLLADSYDAVSKVSQYLGNIGRDYLNLYKGIDRLQDRVYLSYFRRSNELYEQVDSPSNALEIPKIDSSELTINLEKPQQVEFTNLHPTSIPPDIATPIHLYVHLPEHIDDVRANFKAITGYDDGEFDESSRRSSLPFRFGTEFTVIPFLQDADVTPDIAEVTWREKLSIVTIYVTPNEIAKQRGYIEGEIRILVGILVVATIPIRIRVGKHNKYAEPEYQARSAFKYKSIFISYASKDRAFILALENLYKANPEFEAYVDKSFLDAGDEFAPKLFKMIEKAEALQLCWSPNARESIWVDKEWRHAYSLEHPIIPIHFGFIDEDPKFPEEIQARFNHEHYSKYFGKVVGDLERMSKS